MDYNRLYTWAGLFESRLTLAIEVTKVTQVIEDKEITKIVLTNVKYQFIFRISSFEYFATVSITKKGKCRRNRPLEV